MIDFAVSKSWLAKGAYKLNIIAGPIPSSVRDNTVKILSNKPFKPKYSIDK